MSSDAGTAAVVDETQDTDQQVMSQKQGGKGGDGSIDLLFNYVAPGQKRNFGISTLKGIAAKNNRLGQRNQKTKTALSSYTDDFKLADVGTKSIE